MTSLTQVKAEPSCKDAWSLQKFGGSPQAASPSKSFNGFQEIHWNSIYSFVWMYVFWESYGFHGFLIKVYHTEKGHTNLFLKVEVTKKKGGWIFPRKMKTKKGCGQSSETKLSLNITNV